MFLPLITMPYVSRVLGAEGIGMYSYTYSIANYFLLLGLLGVENYGNRSIAKVRDDEQLRNRIFSEIYSLQLVIASGAMILYSAYVFFVAENRQMAMIQTFYVLSAAFDINWLFFGMEDFKLTVTKKMIIKVANLICIFAVVRAKNDLWKYAFVLSGGYFLAQSSMWFFAGRYIKFSPCRPQKKHLKGCLILFVPIIAISVYRLMDKIMLGSMTDVQQVGFYESAEKLIMVCLCVISAFGAVMMPRMSNMLGKGKIEECKDLFVRSMEIAIFIGSAICFGISAVANDFIPVFYGEGYEPSVRVTSMLAITVLFITWACIVRTLYLIPAGKNGIYINSVMLGAFVNIVINAFLIPKYGAVGAAMGTIVAEISVAVFQTVLVRKELPIILSLRKSVPFLLYGLLMWFVVKYMPFTDTGSIKALLMKICTGAGVYLLCSLLHFVVTKNQLLFDIAAGIRRRFNCNNGV